MSELRIAFRSCLAWAPGMCCVALPVGPLKMQLQSVLHRVWLHAWHELRAPLSALARMDALLGTAVTGPVVPRGDVVSSCLFGTGQEPAHQPKQIPSHSRSVLE